MDPWWDSWLQTRTMYKGKPRRLSNNQEPARPIPMDETQLILTRGTRFYRAWERLGKPRDKDGKIYLPTHLTSTST